jgi:hypothetical protein
MLCIKMNEWLTFLIVSKLLKNKKKQAKNLEKFMIYTKMHSNK